MTKLANTAASSSALTILATLAIVALLEYKDTSLRTERDVWAFTKLPTLAVIAYSEAISVEKKPGLFPRFANRFRRKKTKEVLVQANG